MTTAEVTKRIQFNRDTMDFDLYITIDDVEEYIGSAPNHHIAEVRCNEYAINYYTDNHTPEKAAALILANTFALA